MGVKVPWLCGLGRGLALSWMDNEVLGMEGPGILGSCKCTFAPHLGTAWVWDGNKGLFRSSVPIKNTVDQQN